MDIKKSKKIQKQSAGRWTKPEHQRFMNGLQKYGKDWISIQKAVKTRTLTQVRSHAQKTFLKLSEADIEALIGKDQVEEEESFAKYEERDSTNLISYEAFEKNEREGNLFETVKKCIEEDTNKQDMQAQGEPESTENGWLPIESQMNKYVSDQQQCHFLETIRNNYEHFRSGKSFLDMTPAYHNQLNVSFTPFTHEFASKGVQKNYLQ